MTVEGDRLRDALKEHIEGCEEQWRISIRQSENIATRLGTLEDNHKEFSKAVLSKLEGYNKTAWGAVAVVVTAILTAALAFIVQATLQELPHSQTPYMTTTKDYYHAVPK